MICILCEQTHDDSQEYQDLQQLLSIPFGCPTLLESQVISGIVCLDCYNNHVNQILNPISEMEVA